jgi:hypothetical protein
MKKILMTLAAVLCCAMTTTVFTACDSDDNVTYKKTYMYEVKLDTQVSVGSSDEAKTILDAFNNALEVNSNVYNTFESPKDKDMKSKCDAVSKQFTNVKSAYLVYNLYRVTLDPTPGASELKESIATYQFGQALTTPYVTYALSSNETDAYAALEAKKGSLEEKVYNASLKTLRRLLGYHRSTSTSYTSSSSAFESKLSKIAGSYFPESKDDEQYVIQLCDSIAQAHAKDTLAVEAVVKLSTVGLINNQEKEIWKHTFPANF